MRDYKEFVKDLEKLKKVGYIKTHRSGDTGIGKTLEDLLDIQENNIPGPNGMLIELKAARKRTKSMLTLFTKSPLPRKANSVLLQKYGYPSRPDNDRKELHTTVNAVSYNTLKGKTGFKVSIQEDCAELVAANSEVLGYWDKETLKKSFERKLPKLLYVKADCRGNGADEEFWFNEVWLLYGFDFENFLKLLKEGKILVDIRIGQYPNGRPHDHGTAFRVLPDDLELCFLHRERVV